MASGVGSSRYGASHMYSSTPAATMTTSSAQVTSSGDRKPLRGVRRDAVLGIGAA